MPAVTRVGDSNTGHDACPSVPLTAGSPDVFVNGRPVCRVGDSYAVHGCPTHTPHVPHLQQGSPNVFVNGIPVSRIGDAVHCGGSVMEGSPDVFINEMPGDSSSGGSGSSGSGSGSTDQGGTGTTDGGSSTAGIPNSIWGESANMVMNAVELAARTATNYVILNSYVKFLGTDKENLMLCLPEIATAEAERAKGNDRQGWLYLHDMFECWFGGAANSNPYADSNPYWIDWDWVMSYERAQGQYLMFTQPLSQSPNHIFNEDAKEQLGKILCRDGYMIPNTTTDFDFTTLPWKEWEKAYHTHIAVPREQYWIRDGQLASLAAFTLRALACGYTEPLGNNRYRVHVQKISVFAHDIFNFDKELFVTFEYLGKWSCTQRQGALLTAPDGKENEFFALNNEDFRSFREKYNRGRDFLVLTQPNTVESFTGGSYEYTCR